MACCSPCPEQATPTNSHKNRHRPPKENWTTVKLFITSYNDDFFCEREVLRKQVLPDLKAWCETKKVRLQECSIKWGARHPDKRDMQELEKVQTSIENCYYNNVMPLFINISSDSVGWLPMWGEYEDEMIEDYLEAYGLLTEDLEVMYGAYRDDNHNSIFVMRSDAFIESIPDAEKSHFVHRARASERIQEVGYKILKKFPPDRFLQYSCRYKGLDFKKKRPKVELDDCFRKKILDFCKERIAIDYCGESPFVSNNPYTFTKQSQNSFLRRKSSMVIGREDIVERIETYITQEEKDVPLLLLGGPGSGKSSILCKAADVVIGKAQHRQLPGSVGGQWHVFYHFVGAVPGSTTLEPMLKRLLSEMEVTSESSMPKNLESAAQMVCSLLSNPNTKPLIMFVDALNQFAEDQAALVMSWLPRKLAPQVRCVFSLINDTPQHVTLMGRETKPIELQVTPLDMISRKGIIEEMLGRYRKSLSANQTARLLDKESSENPLWLSVACEEIRLIESPPLIDSTIDNLADGLLNLLEQVLSRFEADRGGHLVVATLCLLESSNAGLLESELRQILGNEATLMPPSPFDEKEEKETSEKESVRQSSFLSEAKWNRVFSTLQPFLRPFGESTEGRLDFYHRALSKAVRKKYFQTSEAAEVESSGCDDAYYWWHKKLADYFETVDNVERRVEEHPYHLVCLEDKYRLANCLVNWDVFDKLYKEEFSSQLLIYWRKVGSSSEMVDQYKIALSALEEAGSANEELLSIRYEKVCRVVIQSGKYLEALELLKTAMKIEERELGARPYRMVELFALMAEIYDEKLKLNDFVSPSQLPDLRKTIMYGKKSITLRKQFTGNYHRFKLAMSLMKLAFSLESWEACGGTPEMTGDEALAEGNKYIDMALKIFKEQLNDMGHYAEALMTKGVLAPRGSMEQLKYYNQAMDLCMQIYGEYHILTSRLYINIGIVYEDNGDYKKAYEYFKKWARVSEEILGPEHPKTLRAKGVLKELRYRQIAQQLGEWDYEAHGQHNNNNNTSNDDDEEEVDNEEIIDYYDDIVRTWNVLHLNADNNPHSQLNNQEVSENNPTPPISQINALNISNDSQGHIEVTLNESNGSNLSGGVVDSNVENNDREDTSSSDDDSDINDHGALMNGYYDEDRDNVETEDNPEENEFEDNDLSYDDNFEDYDEQYILHLDTEPVIDEFNVQGLDYGDEDCEIIEMAARDTMYHQNDNRYASDGD